MAKCKDFSQKIQIPECHCFPQGKSTMFFSLFSELAGECTYACTCSNLRLNFWLLTANNYLQYTAAFILGKKYCKQWMYGSGGQGSIAWYIVVLCLSSRWALSLVMYVLLGNYGVRDAACDPGGISTCRLTSGTSPLQHSQACTGDHACYSFSFLKLLFFYLLHGGWLCCVTNQPTFYVAVCPSAKWHCRTMPPPLQVLAMLPVAGRAAWGAEWEQGCQRASGCLQGREQCRTYSRWTVFLSHGFRQLLLEVAPITLKDGHVLRYLNLFCSVFPNWFWCIAFILSLLFRICNWLQLQKAP